jgi:LDH2 family malate/lactate/ureidoglycolate dehydrogenase
MQFTIVLTKQPNFSWRASVPSLPECEAEAETREEVLSQIKKKVASVARHSEVVRVEIPFEPTFSAETNWKHFGIFREDETWSELFDKIEQERNEFGE